MLYTEAGSPWENDDAERALALRWAPRVGTTSAWIAVGERTGWGPEVVGGSLMAGERKRAVVR